MTLENLLFEVDGGVAADNTPALVRAGTDILVAGTSIFHEKDPAAAVRRLQQIAMEAVAEKV